jgi:hypothetical protein
MRWDKLMREARPPKSKRPSLALARALGHDAMHRHPPKPTLPHVDWLDERHRQGQGRRGLQGPASVDRRGQGAGIEGAGHAADRDRQDAQHRP